MSPCPLDSVQHMPIVASADLQGSSATSDGRVSEEITRSTANTYARRFSTSYCELSIYHYVPLPIA